jgi:hypothetical protein
MVKSTTFNPLPAAGRVNRLPKHTFNLSFQPWTIQPFVIAPVLPGETMRNALIQARVLTDPIKDPLIGWWCEYYLFYVKHRDLAGRDDFTAMMLDPQYDMSSYYMGATAVKHNMTTYAGSAINWSKLCLDRVVAEYFRDEGEAEPAQIDGMPVARLGQENYMNSAMNDEDFEIELGSVDYAVQTQTDVDPDTAGDQGGVFASDIEAALRQYQFARANNLTDMSYEDFLRSYGVKVPEREELHRPELIRYLREWTYPSNTVGSDGSVNSACSWSIAERADKDRFFMEPGFLFGVTVVRPKVYLMNSTAGAVSYMNNAISWLPAVLQDDPMTSLKKFATNTGPLGAATTDYWLDMRDLLIYGDQFLNYAASSAKNGVYTPEVGEVASRYAATADLTRFFKTVDTYQVRADGVVSFQIAGRQVDTTLTRRVS